MSDGAALIRPTQTIKTMQKIVLASNNAGKIYELSALLAPLNFEIIKQGDLIAGDAEETGLSFIENAIIKARFACQHTGLAAIADDSGLSVDALQGAPGIYSARYAGEHGNDAANNEKLLADLANVPLEQRQAHFHCALVFMAHAKDPCPIVCHSRWSGLIVDSPRGNNGFGYDPLFYLPEYDCCSAELPPNTKNQISHRAQALKLLLSQLSLSKAAE